MLVGDFPFNGNTNQAIMDRILDGKYEIPKDIKKTLSKQCIDVIFKTLQVDPAVRISTTDLLNHPFISEENMTAKYLEDFKN